MGARTSIGGEAVALKILRQLASEDQRLRFFAERALLGRLGGRHGFIGCSASSTPRPRWSWSSCRAGTSAPCRGRPCHSWTRFVLGSTRLGPSSGSMTTRSSIATSNRASILALTGPPGWPISGWLPGHPPRGLPEGWVEETVGTLGYTAPEFLRAPETATPTMDVYGLGAVLYETLTGRLPAMMEGDETEPDSGPGSSLGRAPPLAGSRRALLAAVIMRAIDPDPGTRFPARRGPPKRA